MNSKNFVVIFLLFLVFLLPFLSMRNFSPVVDEITHLPSGYSYLKTGEIKLNLQHPPLIKILAAFPLLFLDLKFDANDPNLVGPKIQEWQFGRDFLFNNGTGRLIFWGRIPMILISVLLGWYIYRWGRDLFGTTIAETQKKTEKPESKTTETEDRKKVWEIGEKAGIIGLFIYAFMPNIIAHAQFVTTDVGVSAFSFVTLYYLWKFTRNPTKRNIALSGLFLGLALGSKFSAIFLLPLFFVLLAVYIHKTHSKSGWLLKFHLLLKTVFPIFGLAFLAVWVLYFLPSNPLFYWEGLNTVYADNNPNHYYYLNGNFSQDGRWYYFLWAFVIKTPIPFLIILLAALVSYKKSCLNILNGLFIFLPVALFLFVASWKAYNIGVRYVLPIYPFLILFIGGYMAEKFRISNFEFRISSIKIKTVPALILILAGWYIYSSVRVYPDYLAYFNELIGGPANGYKYLDDSNVEWGQDLKRLAEYQKENPDLQVAYPWITFMDPARFYSIKNIMSLSSQEKGWLNPRGKYAVGTNIVIRTKLASQTSKNEKLNWMDNYKPIDRIGQSFFIYEF